MEVSLIFKIAAVGILVSVLCQILKHSGRDEQAFLVSLAGLLMVLFWIVPYIYDLFETMKSVFSSCLCCDFKSTVMAVDRTERGLNGMDIVKVSIVGICGMMLGFILKETRPEFAALVTMMTGFLILGLAAGKVSYLFETMNRLRESFPIDSSYLTVLVKIIGITYIGQFSSAICKDAGYQMIGTQIDLFCKLSVMVLSMPVLLAILDTISEFMI